MLSAYDECTLPLIVYPMENSREAPKKYLGTRAITNVAYASINVFASSNEQMKALHDFWEIDCNYGLDPFVIPLPAFGATNGSVPYTHILARFINDTIDTKNDLTWSAKRDLKILGEVTVITDDAGNIVVSDGEGTLITDNMILSDAIDYSMSAIEEITSYRKVVYGGDDSVKLDYDMETISVDYDDSRSMDNKALSGLVYDGEMNSSNHVKIFEGVQSVPLDIHYDLGEELTTGNINDGTSAITATAIANGWNVVCDGTGSISTNIEFLVSGAPASALVEYTFTALIHSGTLSYTGYYNGSEVVYFTQQVAHDGYNAIEGIYTTSNNFLNVYCDGSVPFEIDLTFQSVKEITTDNSYLTRYNPVTKEFNTLGNSTNYGSSENLNVIINGSFDTPDIWVADTGWNITGGKAYVNSVGLGNQWLKQYEALTVGKAYILTFTVSDYISGQVGTDSWYSDYLSPGWATSNGTHTFYFRAASSIFQIMASDSTILSIDDVSVREALVVSPTYLQENDFGNAVATDVPLIDSDRDYLKLYPEAIGDLWFEKKTHPQLSFSKGNIKHWYPANEGEVSHKWLHDICVPLGTNQVLNDNLNDLVDINALNGTLLSVSGNVLKLEGNGTGDFLAQFLLPSQTAYKQVRMSCMMKSITGDVSNATTMTIRDGAAFEGATTEDIVYALPSIKDEWQYVENVFTLGIDVTGSLYIWIDQTGANTIYVKDVKFEEFEGVSQIASFDPTCRTEYLNTTYGLSNLFMTQDNSGRPTGMSGSDIIEFTGDGRYIDTGWIPTNIFTLETIFENSSNGIHQYCGTINGATNVRYGCSGSGTINIMCGDVSTWTAKSVDSLHHIVLIYDGSNTIHYIDGEEVQVSTLTDISILDATFTVGGLHNSIGISSPLYFKNGYFKVHNSVLTQQEVTTAYNNAKLKYPTLP